MPMLSLSAEETPIIFRPFKSPLPGHTPQGLGKRTLGTRQRFSPGGVQPSLVRNVDTPREQEADDSSSASHRLVLWSPPPDDPEGRQEVVVDPAVSKVLREHQRIGVKFLFDCLMGLKAFNGFGCILADDMGLGKTLQSVCVIWTLLTQGGPHGKPACRKALVVCPASLVKNWAAEFQKWLNGRLKYVAIAESGSAKVAASISNFRYDREARVLIASYETFRGHANEAKDCGIELIVCDEAHKLKNEESATTQCIANLSAQRRLLLSGTPIQNNLEEFFTLVNVTNPGVFGDMRTFRRTLANPILRGREPDASPEERESAEEKLKVVSEVTEQFILRRTNRLNARFLPPKKVFNVFVAPSEFQRRLYHCFLKSNVAQKVLDDADVKMSSRVFATIKRLQKLVNHPFLVRSAGFHKLEAGFDDEEAQALFAEIDALDKGLRNQQRPVRQELSGKMELLYAIMKQIQVSKSGDRIVIISNWTSTLDLIEKMCDHNKWPVHRLDGTTSTTKRMKLVTDFNLAGNPKAFAFLLSSKAGGCGLNLIGANRLVMYDPDWNPANDRQAMARIWRDGQKKPCFIYRFFTTGTIDEKVYQRQICKDGLSTMMVTETGDDDNTDMVRESLAADLVKDLFTFSEDTICATHDMLECKRCVSCMQGQNRGPSGVIDVGGDDDDQFVLQEAEVIEDELCTWSHHADVQGVPDGVLREAHRQCTGKGVTFTMGCHIEFSEETIKRLEEEERALQKEREQKVATASSGAACMVASKRRSPDAEENVEPKMPLQNTQPQISNQPHELKPNRRASSSSKEVHCEIPPGASPAQQPSSALQEGEGKRRRFARLRPHIEVSSTSEQVIGPDS